MKSLLSIFIFLSSILLIQAQSQKDISVTSGHSEIQKLDRKGMQVLIELDDKFVAKN
jgi:hypothetical protein